MPLLAPWLSERVSPPALRAAGACALMRLPCIPKGQKYFIYLALRISTSFFSDKEGTRLIKGSAYFEVLETVDPPCDMAHKKIKLDVASLYSDNTDKYILRGIIDYVQHKTFFFYIETELEPKKQHGPFLFWMIYKTLP